MDFFHSEVAARLIFSLGIVNIVFGLVLFLSCRCIPGMHWTGQLMKHAWYVRFYKVHCWLWWIFWPSVLIHAVIAIVYFGVPF